MDVAGFTHGQQVWLRGERVTFIGCPMGSRLGAAVVRKEGEVSTRVVPLWKLGHSLAESLERSRVAYTDVLRWQ
ncbi:MAG TPA: hypothetical protein VKC65_00770 [Gaiellaceae bacterium]|nr:hypothetical protein [Gaiellaceae bacterium]